MKKIKAFAVLLALLPLATLAQEERIDTVIPKFLSNGYFFREMPQLPDGEKTMSRLKDKEGNSVIVINNKYFHKFFNTFCFILLLFGGKDSDFFREKRKACITMI